jgi:predicted transcriptional regulator
MHQAIQLHQQGKSVKDISTILNISEGRIYQIFRGENYELPKYNINKRIKTLWTQEELDYLRDNPDKPINELAKDLNRGYTSVKSKLRKLNTHRFYHCIVCDTEISQKGRYCKEHNWIERKISQTRNRCKIKNRECLLSEEQMINILTQSCHYCGDTESIGMDRINSDLGYTEDNTVPCCSTCNTMKMDMKTDDWFNHMRKILEHSNV